MISALWIFLVILYSESKNEPVSNVCGFKLFWSSYCKKLFMPKNVLEQNLKFQLYQSVEQHGMPCVKRGEGFCYFHCVILNFG